MNAWIRIARLWPVLALVMTVSAQDETERWVQIPNNWRDLSPYSERLAQAQSPKVIDLAAYRFDTTDLVQTQNDGSRRFFDPDTSTFPSDLVRPAFSESEFDLFIVQANSAHDQSELRRLLDEQNIAIRDYIPNLAYIVELTPKRLSLLSQSPYVFWIGYYQPAWRVHPKLDYLINVEGGLTLAYTVLLDRQRTSFSQIYTIAKKLELDVLDLADRGRDWKVFMAGPSQSINLLAQVQQVVWIEHRVPYQLHNNVARTSSNVVTGRGAASGPIMDVEDVWNRGIRGEGQIASAADTGLSTGNLATLHRDYGRAAEPNNPARVIAGYALGRATWDDPNPNGGHGTHTSGSIVGNGIESGSTPNTNTFPGTSFAGTAPKAQFVFQSIMDGAGNLGGLPADLNNLFQTPYNDGARVHSNSWGAPVAGQYTADSQDVDQFSWNNKDMVITFSAGNSGQDGRFASGANCFNSGDPIDGVIDDDSIGAPGTAKNCITVGATENYRPTFVYEFPQNDCTGNGFTQQAWGWFNGCAFSVVPVSSDLLADNANGMGAFSSRGPADDGRFKPEISAPGIAIVSTRTNQSQGYEQWGICPVPMAQRPHYLSQGGTSMANPLTAGTATLIRQYYEDGWHANNSQLTNGVAIPAQSFAPSAALVKATLINGAWDMAPGQYGGGATQEIPPSWDTNHDIPNNAMGFGRVDLESSLFPGAGFGDHVARAMSVHDITAGLTTGQTNVHDLLVSSGADPLIITLVWTDPYASTGAGTKLVNNLDLVVNAPGGTRYYPNRVDNTGGAVDNLNNVEQVYVSAPASGTWSIDVVGTSVPGNGQPGTTSQPYALIISGILTPPCAIPSVPTGLSATANGLNSIFVDWNDVASDSYNLYRATASGGPYTLIASGLLSSQFTDTTVAGGTEYFYVATAVNNPGCESAFSNEDSATAFGDCSIDPTFAGLQSVNNFVVGDSCGLRLTWNAGSANCGTSLVYNVYRATAPGGPFTLLAPCVTQLFYDDAAVTPGSTYYYYVRAEDSTSGNGGPCNSGNEDNNTTTLSGSIGAGTITVFEDDFDGNQFPGDLWLFGTFPNPVSCPAPTSQWYRPETGFCSGNAMASNDQAANPAYANNLNGLAVAGLAPTGPGTGGILLPSPVVSITLTFDHDYDFQPNRMDGGRLMISANNFPTFTQIAPVGGYPNTIIAAGNACHPWTGVGAYVNDSGGCVSATFDLTAYAGQRIWLAWNHGSNSTGSFDDGWVIDNILIEADTGAVCSTAPDPIQFLTATSTSTQNVLEWLNPSSGAYANTVIRFSTSSYPATPSAGSPLTIQNDGLGGKGTFTHMGLANNTTYYYSAWVDNGSTEYSGSKQVSGRPANMAGPANWVYSTGASAMAPPGIGSVYGVSNDRILHSMETGVSGTGEWPTSWTPMVMNAPAQARPPIVPGAIAGLKVAFLGSQDGYVYAIDADNGGAPIWASAVQLGDIVQGSPAGIFAAFGASVDLVMVGTRNLTAANEFYGLNTATGTTAWVFDNSGGSGDIGIMSGTPSVSYSSNRVYFTSRARAGGSASTVWCLAVTAGSANLVWEAAIGDIDGSPILHNGRIYVGTISGDVHALDANTGLPVWGAPFATGDGPIKVAISPDIGSPDLFFSTTNNVWSISDSGPTSSFNWNSALTSPSSPLVHFSSDHMWIGSGNGSLLQLSKNTGAQTSSLTIGSGTAAVGSPAYSNNDDILFVGTEAGTIHSVSVPLP